MIMEQRTGNGNFREISDIIVIKKLSEESKMKFKELLKARGVNAARLAGALGVSRATVSNWARGESAPSVVKVYAITGVLGVTADELIECFSEGLK